MKKTLKWIPVMLILAMQMAIHMRSSYLVVWTLSVLAAIAWIINGVVTKNRQITVTNVICLFFAFVGLLR